MTLRFVTVRPELETYFITSNELEIYFSDIWPTCPNPAVGPWPMVGPSLDKANAFTKIFNKNVPVLVAGKSIC